MPTSRPPRAFGYGRVSKIKNKFDLSLSLQQRAVTGYYELYSAEGGKLAGVTWGGWFKDDGVSGSIPIFERPASADMFMEVHPGDHVIVKKLDRAFRSLADAVTSLQHLTSVGISLHFVDSGFDTSTAEGRAFLQLMVVFAELERARISERMKEVAAERKRLGMKANRNYPHPSFGYRRTKHQGEYILVPDGARQAFALYVWQLSQLMSSRAVHAWAFKHDLRCPSNGQIPGLSKIQNLAAAAEKGFPMFSQGFDWTSISHKLSDEMRDLEERYGTAKEAKKPHKIYTSHDRLPDEYRKSHQPVEQKDMNKFRDLFNRNQERKGGTNGDESHTEVT